MKSKISCWRLVRSTMMRGSSAVVLSVKRTRVRQGSVDRGRNATRPHARCRSPVMTSMQTTIASPSARCPDRRRRRRADAPSFGAGEHSDDPRFEPVVAQLREYFAGERTGFDLDLRPEGGTAFERRVWAELSHPLRRDRQLRRDRGRASDTRQGARRRPRQRPQPGRDRLPVPPRHRQRRLADRLRRRPREQAHAARPRGRRADPWPWIRPDRIVSRTRRGRDPGAMRDVLRAPGALSLFVRLLRGAAAHGRARAAARPAHPAAHRVLRQGRPRIGRLRDRARPRPTRRSRASSTAAARPSCCASGRRSRPPRSSCSPRSPTAPRSARSSPPIRVRGATSTIGPPAARA
jgi:hypothetical protein